MSNSSAIAMRDPRSGRWQMRSKRGTGKDGTIFAGFNPSSEESIAKACGYVGAPGVQKEIVAKMKSLGYRVE